MLAFKSSSFSFFNKLLFLKKKNLLTVDHLIHVYNGLIDLIVAGVKKYLGDDYKVHGYYSRSIIYHGVKRKINILRVLHKVSGRTHAVLPDFVVPYLQHVSLDIIEFISKLGTTVDRATSYQFKYVLYIWKSNWCFKPANFSFDFCTLNIYCFTTFQLSFFQNHKGNYTIYG